MKYKVSVDQSYLFVINGRPKISSEASDLSLHSCTQTDMLMIVSFDQLLLQKHENR